MCKFSGEQEEDCAHLDTAKLRQHLAALVSVEKIIPRILQQVPIKDHTKCFLHFWGQQCETMLVQSSTLTFPYSFLFFCALWQSLFSVPASICVHCLSLIVEKKNMTFIKIPMKFDKKQKKILILHKQCVGKNKSVWTINVE